MGKINSEEFVDHHFKKVIRTTAFKDYLEGYTRAVSLTVTEAQLDKLTRLGVTNLDNLMLNYHSAEVLIDKLTKT